MSVTQGRQSETSNDVIRQHRAGRHAKYVIRREHEVRHPDWATSRMACKGDDGYDDALIQQLMLDPRM